MYYSTVVDIEQVWKPLSPLLRAVLLYNNSVVDEGNILYSIGFLLHLFGGKLKTIDAIPGTKILLLCMLHFSALRYLT